MEKVSFTRALLFVSFFADAILIDQFTKWFAGHQGWVIYNSGVSFGLGAHLADPLSWGLLVAWILLFLAWYHIYKTTLPAWGGWFFGGALSNIIDRFFFAGVRDWLPVPFFHVRNNLADWAIFLAVGYIILLRCRPFLSPYLSFLKTKTSQSSSSRVE